MNQWKYVKLGEVCTVERGGSPRPIDDFITTDENGINWIKIGDADESMYITKTAQRIKPEGMKKSRYVKPGDFLLSNSMSFGRPYILKIDGCIHDGWLVLRDENNVFDKKFLYYYLSAPITYKKFKSMAVGGVVNNLNSDMVRKVRVPMPSQEEQHQISDRLDRVSNLIFLRKQQLAKLDELVKARFVEMFGDPVYNEMHWETKRLIDICRTIVDCPHSTPHYTTKDTGYKCIRTSAVKKNKILWEKVECISKQEYEERIKRKRPEKGDVIYTREGAILGIATVIDRDYNVALGQRSMLLSPDIYKCTPCFLSMAMNFDSFLGKALGGVSGSASPHINVGDIKALEIIAPPIEIQNQFSTFVEQVDQQKQTVQQSLEKLELLKKALMQEYFG